MGSGCIDPHILHLGISRWMVSFMFRPLCSLTKSVCLGPRAVWTTRRKILSVTSQFSVHYMEGRQVRFAIRQYKGSWRAWVVCDDFSACHRRCLVTLPALFTCLFRPLNVVAISFLYLHKLEALKCIFVANRMNSCWSYCPSNDRYECLLTDDSWRPALAMMEGYSCW
jgi:hypothetical protein